MIGLIISYIIVGAIIGALARLAIPGRQSLSVPLTIGLGIVGAMVGGLVTRALLGSGSSLITILVSVAVAALLVFLVSGGSRSKTGRI